MSTCKSHKIQYEMHSCGSVVPQGYYIYCRPGRTGEVAQAMAGATFQEELEITLEELGK